MSLRKPITSFSASLNTLSSLTCYQSHSPRSPPPLSSCQKHERPRKIRRVQQCSHYATTASRSNSFSYDDLYWPKTGHPRQVPSPYQIFDQKSSDPYSKTRFYELVKLYHPDRNKHNEKLSAEEQAVMLERYRLIIMANSILSDPNRRKAYDQFGVGWFQGDRQEQGGGAGCYKYSTYHRWYKDGPSTSKWAVDEDPMMNANWEDWERWHWNQYEKATRTSRPYWTSDFFTTREKPPHQRTIFTNNYAFISMLLIFATLAGIGQSTRAHELGRSRVERNKAVSEETARLLTEVRQESRGYSDSGESKQGRIQRFLREKDSYGENEFDARAARPDGTDGGLCVSGSIKDRGEPQFWQKPPGDG